MAEEPQEALIDIDVDKVDSDEDAWEKIKAIKEEKNEDPGINNANMQKGLALETEAKGLKKEGGAQNVIEKTQTLLAQARKAYETAAEEGCIAAHNNLGAWHEIHAGDIKTAMACYQKGMNAGDIFARVNLARCFSKKGMTEKAIELYQPAANAKDTNALFFLGEIHYNQNRFEQALPFLHQAAQQNNARAAYLLGVCYKTGKGVDIDLKQAADFYEQAAHLGHKNAQYNTAFGYQFGQGREKNEDSAISWYKLAATQGHKGAQRNLGILFYNRKRNSPYDRQQAAQWLHQAAQHEDAVAQRYLGLLSHSNGNSQEAKRLLQMAIDNGDEPAKRLLEKCLKREASILSLPSQDQGLFKRELKRHHKDRKGAKRPYSPAGLQSHSLFKAPLTPAAQAEIFSKRMAVEEAYGLPPEDGRPPQPADALSHSSRESSCCLVM